MYYPKSQIKTNLYTNGSELVTTTNNQLYQGYYYETSNGQLFTGKNPQDGPNILLSLQNLTTLYDPTNVLDNPDFDNTIYYYNITDINYDSVLRKVIARKYISNQSTKSSQPTILYLPFLIKMDHLSITICVYFYLGHDDKTSL
jgi:hypothetical protein